MKKILPFILLGIAALFLGGWGAMATTSASTGVSTGSSSEYGEYGSDSYLDDLYDDCSSGDSYACEDLYYESPVNSEYEAFGQDQPWPGEYGSDPYLDDLYDYCSNGDSYACEDLYYEAPADSEYEEFGYDQPWPGEYGSMSY